MRPARLVSLTAEYRYSDVDVQTPVFLRDTGSVNYDSSFLASDDPSEYHSVKRNAFDVDGAVEVLPFTSLKVGFSNLGTDYTHRIWENSSESVLRLVDTTAKPIRDAARSLRETIPHR